MCIPQRPTTISYGNHPRQSLDYYAPHAKHNKNSLVVFVYGGAWTGGSKSTYAYIGRYFAKRGYPTIIPNYRLYPEVQFPLFIEDVAMAIQHFDTRKRAQYDDIILIGHSAGAHTAATLTFDNTYFKQQAIAKPIAKFIGISGPYDLPFNEEVTPIFQTTITDQSRARPLDLASTHSLHTEIILIHGDADTRVGIFHAKNLLQKLTDGTTKITLYELLDVGHIKPLIELLPFFNRFSQTAAILTKHLP